MRSSARARFVLGSAIVLVALMAVPAASAQTSGSGTAAGCARSFDEAQRTDMESFAAYDAETFRDGHHPEAITVFASGARRFGVDAIMEALAPHFEDREAIWTWTELYRFVDGCKTGYILYETWYEVPSSGAKQHALTAVTYVREQGRWLAIADQGTLLP